MGQALTIAVLALVLAGFLTARGRARALAGAGRLASVPVYHASYVALWTGIPTLLLTLLWLLLERPATDWLLLRGLPDGAAAGGGHEAGLVVAEIRNVAAGRLFTEPAPAIREAAATLVRWQRIGDWAMLGGLVALAIFCLILAHRRLAPVFPARQRVERILDVLMIACSVIAVLTTLGIIVSLAVESARFFALVPWHEFLFGLRWEPQIAIRADQVAGAGAFGAVPVFLGTLVIAAIAMAVAIPIGLLTAVYMVEYATPRFRDAAKPTIEVLAGIPTVVYGFFAVLVVAPALRDFGQALGLSVEPNSALAAGAVMGIMIIPFISSLSDDALNAVPSAMRDGSLALGATRAETMVRVLLPAALPGIMGGVLLAVSRAIGETMIVVMAAGLIASMNANPLGSVTTVTVQIVTLLIGDTAFDSPKTLAAFALGLVLFLVTLSLNLAALKIVQKYREKYE